MIRFMTTAVVTLSALAFASPGFAADLCKKTDGPTKSEAEIRTLLEGKGYKVTEIGTEDGCVEAKGTNKGGKKVEVYVDPVSGEVVKVKEVN
ncbi:PepSY domain-containing protein [Pararhodospirillum photometricum]|nr:PepSY domain-containing protein [Pararhodospirillum photometricum]